MEHKLAEYDPMQAIDPEQWLALEEGDRLDRIYEFHQDAGVKVPDMETHATLHCVIEKQIALGDELPIAGTLRRLLEEGLDRHDAIHAIASVLVNHLFDMVHGEDASRAQDIYFAEVGELTAAQWLHSA